MRLGGALLAQEHSKIAERTFLREHLARGVLEIPRSISALLSHGLHRIIVPHLFRVQPRRAIRAEHSGDRRGDNDTLDVCSEGPACELCWTARWEWL